MGQLDMRLKALEEEDPEPASLFERLRRAVSAGNSYDTGESPDQVIASGINSAGRAAYDAAGDQIVSANNEWADAMAKMRQGDYSGLNDHAMKIAEGTFGAGTMKLAKGAAKAVTAAKPVAQELSMAELPRKMRAIEMGFDPTETWFHGTTADIKAFDKSKLGSTTGAPSAKEGFFFTSQPRTADTYANAAKPGSFYDVETEGHQILDGIKNHFENSQSWKDKQKAGNLESYIKDSNTGENISLNDDYRGSVERLLDDAGIDINDLPDELKKIVNDFEIKSQTPVSEPGPNVLPSNLKMENPYIHDFKGDSYREQTYNDIIKRAKSGGHDSVILKNTFDYGVSPPPGATPEDIAVVFKPNQIRSKFAAFDPSKASSGDLSAGLAGALTTGGLAEFLRRYKALEDDNGI